MSSDMPDPAPEPGREKPITALWVLVALAAVQVILTTVLIVAAVVLANAANRSADSVRDVACELNRAYCHY